MNYKNFKLSKIKDCKKIVKYYKNKSYNIIEIDIKDINNKYDLFKIFSFKLKFPNYFGNNWDAFEECIQDLDWLKNKNCAILIKNYTKIKNKQFINPLIDILKDSILFWKKQGYVFEVLIFKNERKR